MIHGMVAGTEREIRRWTLHLALVASACILSGGCMTSSLVYWATEDHSPFDGLATIESAALYDEDLYIILKPPLGTKEAERKAARIRLEELDLAPPRDPVCTEVRLEEKPARIKVKPAKQVPQEAIPIPVVTRALGGGLKELVGQLPPGPHLVVLEVGSYRHPDIPGYSLGPFDDPTLLLVLPSTGGIIQTAVMTRFQENPWKRRPWLILTPATAAGDVVTFPLLLVVMMFGPEC